MAIFDLYKKKANLEASEELTNGASLGTATPVTNQLRPRYWNKKRAIGWTTVGVVSLIIIAGAVWYRFYSSAGSTGSPSATKKTVPKPEKLASLVNGVLVDSSIANRHVVAAMIENSPDARPQTGLTSADVVYEAVTEGGITRFMGIFQQTLPDKAGPIRSARSYFIDWLSEYDGFYAHAGGSPTALSRISSYGIKDYSYSYSDAYHREPQAGLASEHTLYGSIAQIYKSATEKKKWPTTYDVASWQFKDPATTQPATSSPVTVDFSSPQFKVSWTYDPTLKTYARTMAGVAHKDKISGAQITASAVITMTVARAANGAYKDSGKESEWTMQTIGSGVASVFQDGVRADGTWKKPSRLERTKFYYAAGAEIKLNRGKIWVEVVPPTGSITM